ncbi:MAG: transposase, partial [Rubrobacter sp.]|nr:transposase [Rubrobacter sp.]
SHFVKASALRWVSMALLAEVPWASRVWALPFLSALAPSERYCGERGVRHKKITDWAWQMLAQTRRWQPRREIVAVADGSYASLRLLDRCRNLANPITFITRLRLDAALYEPAPPRGPRQNGGPRLKGSRLPNLSAVLEDPRTQWTAAAVDGWYGGASRTVQIVSRTVVWYSTGLPAVPLRWVLIRDPRGEFESQALLCTDLSADPVRIISYFARRWRMESTFQEVRQRLGFETQRHWSETAIRRTAPALLALFSLVTLFADQYGARMPRSVRRAAWYEKENPTFSDALAVVRKELWRQQKEAFRGSVSESDTVKVPREFVERLTEAVCYAA